MDNIKNSILAQIKRTILNFENKKGISTRWKEPILGFADSSDPIFEQLKEVAFEEHLTPYDILDSAKTVVAYFLPFEDFVWESNIDRRTASIEWANAYVETNILIGQVNDDLIEWFKANGYKAAKLPPEKNMDYENLKSVWSNRHVAYIAGVGKFGLNNMLITEKGCCGRLGNVVTSLKIEPTQRTEKENCLFKYGNSCKICVDRCVNDALFIDNFDRFKCYEMCLENKDIYRDLGDASICGKCLVGLPCSSKNPVV